MKLIINRVSVCFNKNHKEFFFLDKDTCVSEYTINNPKLVDCRDNFKGMETFTGVVKDQYDDIAHYVDGKFHRVDGPAIKHANGTTNWLFNGKLHREGGPAIECPNGDKEWWFHGKRHRRSGPAIEHANGVKGWWFNGKLHGHGDDFTNKSWIIFLFVNGFIPDYYH